MAMAAMIFTISCSDGESGKDGADCKLQVNADSKYDVLCGGAKVGELYSPNGAQGQQGQQGQQGASGANCELGYGAGDSYQIICGGSVKGILEGCHTEEDVSNKEVLVTCLGSSGVGICDGTLFDPSKETCTSGVTSNIDQFCGPNELPYNASKQYCGFLNKGAVEAGSPSVLKKCGVDKPNDATEGADGWWELVGDEWKDEYCQVNRIATDALTGSIDSSFTLAEPDTCGGVPVKYNENVWKGQYCGFASATSASKTLLSNSCGDGGAPDEDGFGKKYCQMESKDHKLTSTVGDDENQFCYAGESRARTPINKVDKHTLLKATDWLDEYCGYASEADETAEVASVLTGVCGDNIGPNNIDEGWNNDYCQATAEVDPATGKLVDAKSTVKVGGSDAYCIKDASDNFKTAPASARFNEKIWQKQYCGYASETAYTNGELSRLTGICDDNNGPNAFSWEAAYCQAIGPFSGTYATRHSTQKVAYSSSDDDIYCGITAQPTGQVYTGSLNKDEWRDQFCGYASRTDFNKVPPVKSPQTGFCDDGNGPNSVANTTVNNWGNQYCQGLKPNEVGAPGNKLVSPGDLPGTDRVTGAKLLSVLCPTGDSTGLDGTYTTSNPVSRKYTLGGGNRLNEKSWKGEYCGYKTAADTAANGGLGAFAKMTGVCDKAGAEFYVGPNEVRATGRLWLNEYCQANSEDNKTERVSFIKSDGTAAPLNIFCSNITSVEGPNGIAGVTAPGPRLNDKSWKGEYCYDGNKMKASCLAGQQPVGYNSSSTPKILWGTGNSTDNPHCIIDYND
jgi:hypothetical protein